MHEIIHLRAIWINSNLKLVTHWRCGEDEQSFDTAYKKLSHVFLPNPRAACLTRQESINTKKNATVERNMATMHTGKISQTNPNDCCQPTHHVSLPCCAAG